MNVRLAEILGANRRFYEAFASGDFSTMNALWSERAHLVCVHPGWMALTDRTSIMESWRQILEQGGAQVRCLEPRVHVMGELALVVCQELLPNGLLAATNGFVREDAGWRMTFHQAGPIYAAAEEPAADTRRN